MLISAFDARMGAKSKCYLDWANYAASFAEFGMTLNESMYDFFLSFCYSFPGIQC